MACRRAAISASVSFRDFVTLADFGGDEGVGVCLAFLAGGGVEDEEGVGDERFFECADPLVVTWLCSAPAVVGIVGCVILGDAACCLAETTSNRWLMSALIGFYRGVSELLRDSKCLLVCIYPLAFGILTDN
jgi:hypothetical protein